MTRTSFTLLAAGLLALALMALALLAPATAQRPQPEVHGVFDGDTMYTLLPPDGIPAIRDPEYVTDAAADSQMSDHETVIGVVNGDDAVCWSTWHLDSHEIVNDELAGRAIAATW